MSTEQPAYETVKRDGNFEVRRYNGYIMAQVDVRADFDDALYQGFRTLFGYITGRNRVRSKIPMTVPVTEEIADGHENIPMTAPVTAESAGEGVYRVSFVMPGRYTLETLPKPDDEAIHFREVGDHNAAVIRFSGHAHQPRVREKIRQLEDWMRANGLAAISGFRLARYDPPWIPGFMRRNEVMADL